MRSIPRRRGSQSSVRMFSRSKVLRDFGSPLLGQGEGEGEGSIQRGWQVDFQTPHLRPLPFSKGRGGKRQTECGAQLVLRSFPFERGFAMHANMSKHLVLLPITVCFVFALIPASTKESPMPVASAGTQQNVSALDPAAATQTWLATVPRNEREKSDAYFEGGYWLILWNFLLAAAISIFLLTSRISARLRDFAERVCRGSWQLPLQVILYAIPYFLIVAALSFPLNLYENFFREHQYGLATESFLPWFREQLIGLGIAIIGGTVLLIVLYAVFRRAPRTWWIWGTVVAIVFMFVIAFIAPVFIEPLFNTYKPLTRPEIRDPILAMARANQIPVKQVFEVDASRQTTRVSANRIRINSCAVRRSSETLGRQMGRARDCGSCWASLARIDLYRAGFRRHAVSQYGRTRDRARSRCFRNQHFARARWHGKGGAQTRCLPQTRSDAARGIHLFRSSQRPLSYPHGHGLESSAFAGGRITRSGRWLYHSLVAQPNPFRGVFEKARLRWEETRLSG